MCINVLYTGRMEKEDDRTNISHKNSNTKEIDSNKNIKGKEKNIIQKIIK